MPYPRQDQEPGVVHHPWQVALACTPLPADERISRAIVQRGCAPQQQGDKLLADECRVADRFTRRLHEAQIVVALHVQPEAIPLGACDGPNRQRAAGLAFHETGHGSESPKDLHHVSVPIARAPLDPLHFRLKPKHPPLRHRAQEHRARDVGRLAVGPQPAELATHPLCDATLMLRRMSVDQLLDSLELKLAEHRTAILEWAGATGSHSSCLSHDHTPWHFGLGMSRVQFIPTRPP